MKIQEYLKTLKYFNKGLQDIHKITNLFLQHKCNDISECNLYGDSQPLLLVPCKLNRSEQRNK